MSRYRLLPTTGQQVTLQNHCAHARYVWNLAVEQHRHWRPGRTSALAYLEQCRQLTAARAEHPWLAAGSQMVQQQALRDFAQAKANYFAGTPARPRPARVEPASPGQAGRRPAAGPRGRYAQRLGREGLHRHRPPVRGDQGRGPADR
jgi:hypothetical protein